MSIVLKDGTVLPDLPAEAFKGRAYGLVYGSTITAQTGSYMAVTAASQGWFVPKDFTNEPWDNIYFISVDVMRYTYDPETDSWGAGEAINAGAYGVPMLDTEELSSEPMWSNHDILIAAEMGDTGFVGTEIYFPNSLAKPPFILPDGTELPALPDGCFDGTPYGMIIGIDWAGNGQMMYSMQATSTPIVALPAELVPEDSGIQPGDGITHMIMMQPGTGKAYMVDGEAWTAPENGDVSEPVVSFGIGVVLWANHDLNEVATLNADDMSYTIGTEIARKSDENYRVTGGYMTSIANEARRLGGKTGGMLPAVTEETLRGVTAGGSSLPSNARVYYVGAAESVLSENSFNFTT